ncbi:hypothetical protein D1872_159480 [compost metagenome]
MVRTLVQFPVRKLLLLVYHRHMIWYKLGLFFHIGMEQGSYSNRSNIRYAHFSKTVDELLLFLIGYHVQNCQWLLRMIGNRSNDFRKMLCQSRHSLPLVQRCAVFQTAQNTFRLLYRLQAQIKLGRMIFQWIGA